MRKEASIFAALLLCYRLQQLGSSLLCLLYYQRAQVVTRAERKRNLVDTVNVHAQGEPLELVRNDRKRSGDLAVFDRSAILQLLNPSKRVNSAALLVFCFIY